MKIGVISDTHGTIQRAAFDYLHGCDLILHAGDIGGENILVELGSIAPVKAVSGNTDVFPITQMCKKVELIEEAGKKIYLVHRFMEGNFRASSVVNDINAQGPDIVVFGHTHRQHVFIEKDILYFNPGSAGLVRPGTRPGVGMLTIKGPEINHEIFYLE